MTPAAGDDIRLRQTPDARDIAIPFRLANLDVRGRVLRLDHSLDLILAAHAYPDLIARRLAEALGLTALLGTVLREDQGKLTLQAQGKGGPVPMLVADYRAPGEIRGYAQFDPERVAELSANASLNDLFGQGYLAITIEAAGADERYQGIVELSGADFCAAAETYFENSEQLPTLVRIDERLDPVTGRWHAGGLILQYLPTGEEGGERLFARDVQHADWEHARILGSSIRNEELTDPSLPLEQLLWRLFHEEEVRVFEPVQFVRGCRCSIDHIREVIGRFGEEERSDMREADGLIHVNCAFCSKDFALQM